MLDAIEFGKTMAAIVKDALAPLYERIESLERRETPTAVKGDPGKDAEPVDIEAIANEVVAKLLASDRIDTLTDLKAAEAVSKHFEDNPVRDGKDGEQGPQGERGDEGQPGSKGADGIGLAGALIGRDGDLVVTLSNGEVKSLGHVVGTHGKDGQNGRDGLSFETAAGEFDAERGFVIRMANGDRTAEFVLPYMRHAGFWSEGKSAGAGESMTHDGALWIAKRGTKAKPCAENADDWILAARKGRDGKDGRNGIDKTAAVKVGQ